MNADAAINAIMRMGKSPPGIQRGKISGAGRSSCELDHGQWIRRTEPVRHAVVTHVLGTTCYLCVRVGQFGSGAQEGIPLLAHRPDYARDFLRDFSNGP